MPGNTESKFAKYDSALTRCLVEADPAAVSSERHSRRMALGMSLAIETAALALLIAAPLMTSTAWPNVSRPAFVPFVFGATHTHHTEQPPTKLARRWLKYNDNMLTYTVDQAPRQPIQTVDEGEESAIPDPGLGLEHSVSEELLTAGLRPPGPVVPPGEIKRAEEKRPLKMSEPIVQAQLISRSEPRYPFIAIQTRTEGTVRLRAIISRDGRISELQVLSGPPLLVQAALDAVRQWRYRPTYLNGEPVEVETSITVIFRLQQ